MNGIFYMLKSGICLKICSSAYLVMKLAKNVASYSNFQKLCG